MNILGISCYYHDAAAALLVDGHLVAAAEEERFSRKKHDSSFPELAIAFCFDQAGIAAGDLDYVVFYEKPLLKFERIFLTALATFPRSWRSFGESMITWFDEKLWIRSEIERNLGIEGSKLLFVDHHVAHAASAFYCSPFEEAAILTVDGVGEWTTTATGRGRASWTDGSINEITLTSELRFPHSLGLLYSAFTAFLGFEVNEGEYKVMGMAPYGEPKYQDLVYKVMRVESDGSFTLDMDYFSFHHSAERTYSRKFVELLGKPRDPESDFFTRRTHPGVADSPEVRRNEYYADVAASIQRVTEDTLLLMANHLHRETGLTRLCLAGGVALNSVANGRILRETPFQELFIQPAAGDAGGAVGAALHLYHEVLGKPRRYVMETAYLGQEFGEDETAEFLRSTGVPFRSYDDDRRLIEEVTRDLTTGKVVGWFQGRFEWGPRALGNRSIIADPRRAEMKEIVNEKIKFREPFRPFAPAVLEGSAAGMFTGLESPEKQYPARYMLLVLPWDEEYGARVPAVNHEGTGRVQTVRREWNPRYHDLISGFGDETGIPVLMNTSFNLRGEPVVTTPSDAWNTFQSSGIDVLVLGNHVVRK